MEDYTHVGDHIRDAAYDVRRRWAEYQQLSDIDGPIAAELKLVAKQLFRLSVVASRKLGSNVLGKINLRTRVIQYRAALDAMGSEAHRAFVIAHEIGHFVLRHRADIFEDDPRTVDDEADPGQLAVRDGVYRTYSDRERQELEANLFASELLSPISAIARAVADDPNWSVDTLAKWFGLTHPAAENRLAVVLLQGGASIFRGVVPLQPKNATIPMNANTDSSPKSKKNKIPDAMQEAATIIPAPALIQAGPGSGKTTVLVNRYVRLIREEGCAPDEILTLTFTNKAAAEMRSRIVAAFQNDWTPEQLSQIQVTTLHGLGLDLITRHIESVPVF